MATDADLEIGLVWNRQGSSFEVSIRFDVPGTTTDEWTHSGEPLDMPSDQLRALRADPDTYAKVLSNSVMGRKDIHDLYRRARAWVDARPGSALHLRLHIVAPASFHEIYWELLRDPISGLSLATQDRILLSRYLGSANWRPVPNRPVRQMRAVVAVAGPTDVDRYQSGGAALAPVRVADELASARKALTGYDIVTVLGEDRPATLQNLLESIESDVDVLYLTCHGVLSEDVPNLLLTNDKGRGDAVDGRRLVERFAELDQCPVLVVLNSCQSAGRAGALPAAAGGPSQDSSSQDDGVLAALGPRLAGVGVAAVVAMQGNVTMETAGMFSERFFAAFLDDGVVDGAMAKARRGLFDADRQDWWVPVLFSRLRSGRTQYRPAFADREDKSWENLKTMVKGRSLAPVVGPGLADNVLGSREQIAKLWVRRWQIPLAAHHQGDLAQVAQFLRVRMAIGTVRTELLNYYRSEALERRTNAAAGSPYDLTDEILNSDDPTAAAREINRRQRADDPGEPYRVIASLDVPLYITTGWTDLLEDALRDKGKKPIRMAFPWNSPRTMVASEGERRETGFAGETIEPSTKKPVVYHMFGHISDERSLVITEDDYFSWLRAWTGERRQDIPTNVREALTSKSLLFLGYRLDDWDFRVLFQSIQSFPGSEVMFRENLHSGVQLSPDNQSVEPEVAQEYLESYFGEKFTIFWGDTRTFLDEFRDKVRITT